MGCLFLFLIDTLASILKSIFECIFALMRKVKSNVFILWEIKKQLNRIEALLSSMLQAKTIEFYTTKNGRKIKVVKMFLKLTEKLPLSIEVKDALGNAAQVDGAPAWALSNPDLGSLIVADNGLSATFFPSTAVGQVEVQVLADADLGEGVKQLLGTLVIDLISGEAVSVSIVAGSPLPL